MFVCRKATVQLLKQITRCHHISINCYAELQTTVQERLFQFLRTNHQYRDKMVTPYEYERHSALDFDQILSETSYRQMGDSLTSDQFPYFIYHLSLIKNKLSPLKFNSIFKHVDTWCSQQVIVMNNEDMFKCLDAWLYVFPGNITHLQFPLACIHNASWRISKEDFSYPEIILLMFYAGMKKKISEAQSLMWKCLYKIERNIDVDLSKEELCIVANASYKTGTKIKSINMLKFICQTIDSDLQSGISDIGYFISLIKSLRYASFYDFELMEKIAEYIKEHPTFFENLNFTTKIHILAYYAEALFCDDDFIQMFIQTCTQDIYKSFQDYASIRTKDISRFLWSVGYMGYSLPADDVRNVLEILNFRLKLKEHLKDPANFISCLLSLWMMGYREDAGTLFQLAVTKQLMNKVKEMDLFRIGSRLSLLLKCISIEKPEILSQDHVKWDLVNVIPPSAIQKHVADRNALNEIYICTKCLSSVLNLNVICECSIDNLNIVGITVTASTGECLHIEVVDPSVCLHQSNKPHGLMKLKLRLLDNLGHKTLVINSDQLESLTKSNELYVFIEEKLKEVFFMDKI